MEKLVNRLQWQLERLEKVQNQAMKAVTNQAVNAYFTQNKK